MGIPNFATIRYFLWACWKLDLISQEVYANSLALLRGRLHSGSRDLPTIRWEYDYFSETMNI
jgi:hypothetical protein